MRRGLYRRRFEDPAGEMFGLPTWPHGHAPAHLATRRQLRIVGLAPGGQEPAGQVMWLSRKTPGSTSRELREQFALLYDLDKAVPKRSATPAVLKAVSKALAARRTCPTCHIERDYCIPLSLGECLECAPAGALT